ncbi:YcxB family protein [Novosphingobium sp. TH158]|uniref:YcxB family protein n=1 Tax=Novosphingobium sp. TH158 TaxID=2067455 RepID=UPI000C7D020F|nr:YcxB family protein [Novosphingobium sp. TH158]PLK25827.1 hypothetical protein C0V78_02160 [Novosphingobium sp. TH158]
MERHEFTLQLTPQDCAEGAALLAGRHPLRRIGPLVIVAISLAVGALVAIATARLGHQADVRRAFGLGSALCALFLGVQYLMLLRIAVQTTRRSIEAGGWCERAVSGRIDDEGLAFGDGSSALAWSAVRRCIEGTDHFAITSASLPPIILPKRAIGPDAGQFLRAATVRA